MAEHAKRPKKAPFVWPPRPRPWARQPSASIPVAAAPASTPQVAESDVRRRSRVADLAEHWLRALEETWLGIVGEPLERRAERAGWRVLSMRDYCTRCGRPHEHEHSRAAPSSSRSPGEPCDGCVVERPPWERLTLLNVYREDLAAWIREVKFHKNRALARSLGTLLGRSLRDALAAAGREQARVIIVPVPMTTRRRLWRGIDHARVIADAVARELNANVWAGVARAHRPSQISVSMSARATNLAGAFSPRRPMWERLAGFHAARAADATHRGTAGTKEDPIYVVIDDVMTTGATMRGVCRALRQGLKARGQSRATVWSAVLSVSPGLGMSDDGLGGAIGRRSGPGGGGGATPPGESDRAVLRELERDREEAMGTRGGIGAV